MSEVESGTGVRLLGGDTLDNAVADSVTCTEQEDCFRGLWEGKERELKEGSCCFDAREYGEPGLLLES